jgi:hypothetical protein
MEQNEFVSHPIITNYEANRNGIIRNCRRKKPVGSVTNAGYLAINTKGNKNYLSHRFVIECFLGPIKDGYVVDHINHNKVDNSLNNLRIITQSENCKSGKTGGARFAKAIKSVNKVSGEEIMFKSIYSASKYFNIAPPSVKRSADGVIRSAFSKRFLQNIMFRFLDN